ncbi:MAG: ATP-dependent DNA helicase RecG [Eubacteriales bacterium]|nr:ATP-dependent DNA helicase RecG [Eubacteriales bacterium]
MNERTGISGLKGIGEKTEKLFLKIGIKTVGDLIRYYPRGYDVYQEPVAISELVEGETQTITGIITGKVQVSPNRKMPVTSAQIRDKSGTIKAIWFRMPFLRNTLLNGEQITLRGLVIRKKDGLVVEHPEIFYPCTKYEAKLNTLQPKYTLTKGVSNNLIIKAMKQAIDSLDLKQELLPEELRMRYHLAEYNYAIRGIHFPEDKDVLYHARERLVFEEFLEFIVSIRKLRTINDRLKNCFQIKHCETVDDFLKHLPFQLTNAQMNVWKQIESDMMSEYSMSRLVQGDVGSGKTIVAVLALITVACCGYQGAMMAPTEVLARQHYESVKELFEQYQIPFGIELLTGSMKAKEKRAVYERIEKGKVQIIIGTHALIQDKVSFNKLALVITDEQHRFGVKQREAFAEKGTCPHILVMSATPIPRTLAIILYGDLDISVIDELPANRLPIKNCVVDTSYRQTAYRFLAEQVKLGRQCYVICPMVEESEHLEVENVVDYASMLQNELGDSIRVDYLHGKMKQLEKDEIMNRFSKNEIHILVSTTVIEVGINVPNATVMMVENAERFGLAQLHQLRGRVGRGKYQSYCIFMSGSKSKETKKRLEILNSSNDGFKIAGEDLKLRGPGDLFGIRQSGLMDFKLGDVYQDASILQKANEAADWLIKTNSDYLDYFENEEKNASVIL